MEMNYSVKIIEPKFVDYIPELDQMELGVLYISMEFGSVAHKCLCGCGQEVITPLSPTDWELVYDGESISLNPSIGNWVFECQSHYWIKNNKVIWAATWTKEKIHKGRKKDLSKKKQYYQSGIKSQKKELTFIQRIKKLLF